MPVFLNFVAHFFYFVWILDIGNVFCFRNKSKLLLGESAGRLRTPEPETSKIKQYKAKWQKEENDEYDQVGDVELVTIEPC